VSPVAPPFGDKLYTIALAPATNGSGWGALTGRLKSQGRMTVTGTLGDGTKISQSTLTSTNGDFPLFLPLSRGKGMLLGWLALAGDTPRGEHILWMRPSETAGLSTSNAFTVMPEVFGSLYTAPRAGANLLSLTTGVLVFSRGNALTTALTNSFALAKNKIRFSTNPDQLALKLNLANGTFSGTFLAPGTVKKTPFVGVVLQQYNQGVGNFRDADKSGEVLLLDAKP